MILNLVLTVVNAGLCVTIGMYIEQLRQMKIVQADHETRIRALENKK